MGLKDWGYAVPPVKGYEKVFDNRKTSERIFIAKNKTKITPSQKRWSYSYTVYIDGEKSMTFISLNKALANAMKYMREN